jgi:cyanophycin synthetase
MVEAEGAGVRREIRLLDGPSRFVRVPGVLLTLGLQKTLGVASEVEKSVAQVATAVMERAGLPPEMSEQLVVRSAPNGDLWVAFPRFDRRQAEAVALAIGDGVVAALAGEDVDAVVERAAGQCAGVEPDEPPVIVVPGMPTVAVTGTNGKTTVSRLVAHIAREAGHHVARCDSDGVYDGETAVERGDWTGFLGVRRALEVPHADFAALEIARGGILRRGLGATEFDVSVVTNIAADHLGRDGVETLEDMTEVKSVVVRATRPTGWVVVNAEDGRALGMRHATSARPFGFSLSPDAAGIGAILDEGGSAISARGGEVVRHEQGHWRSILDISEIPITFGGLSRHNVANALAGAAAALAVGLPLSSVLAGLRTFTPSAGHNPGRMNVFELDGVLILVDYGHNEDGLGALMELAKALTGPAGQVHLVLNGLGDRPADLIFGLARTGAELSDTMVIAERESAPRGRPADEHFGLLRAGAEAGGKPDVLGLPTEVEAAQAVLDRAQPGDVCSIMCHAERVEMATWLEEIGAVPARFSAGG